MLIVFALGLLAMAVICDVLAIWMQQAQFAGVLDDRRRRDFRTRGRDVRDDRRAGDPVWSTIITAVSIGLAFAVLVSIGLVFGLYPAVRASKRDPVIALHYE